MATQETPAATGQHGRAGHSSTAQPVVPGSRAWIVLVTLIFVYALNFLCRQLPGVLGKQIEDSLHISDGQLGLVTGLFFALFYCCISIPVGFLADKTSRTKVLALACAIWSLATMACGLVATYPLFVISFLVVGFGEAGGVPPSYAIISDYFPPGRRGTALGLFNLGPPIGMALGIAAAASIAAAFGWRTAFVSLGIVGVFTVIGILLIVREPRRGGLDPVHDQTTATKAGFWQTLVNFFSRPVLLLAALGGGATQFITYGMGNFVVIFLQREKGMTLHEVSVYYALIVGIVMSASMFVSGRVIDRFTRRSKQAYALIPAISLIFAIPFYLAFVWAPNWHLALLMLIGPIFFNYFYLSATVTLVQQEVRPDQRVMSGALLLLVMNMIGLGFGPPFVGAASDFYRAIHFDHSLQLAFYTVTPFYVLAILLFLRLARALRKESRKAGETVS